MFARSDAPSPYPLPRGEGWRSGLLGVVLATSLLGTAAGAQAQAGCRFVLGFAQIRAAIGAQVVGECLEDERANPENGDSLQHD